MIRALIFDFDGLIFDTETPLIAACGLVHARHGGPFDRERFLRSTGQADYASEPWHGLSPHADRAALELDRRALKDRACSGGPFSPASSPSSAPPARSPCLAVSLSTRRMPGATPTSPT